MRHSRSGNYLSALAIVVVASSAAPAPAAAQSSACYKGDCSGLDVAATGSNYNQLAIGGNTRLPIVLQGTSGGDVDVTYLTGTQFGACVGWATVLPDHIVTLRDFEELRIEVEASRDTALLVHGPDGWRCNDDSDDADPVIDAQWAAGVYRIWVASYNRGYHDYELTVQRSSAPPVVVPPVVGRPPHGGHGGGGRPRPSLDATSTSAAHDALIFRPGDGTSTLSGRAGGTIDASSLTGADGESCAGFSHAEPDHILTLTERFEDLELFATSTIDTTLVVHGPHGWRCNDDFEGHNPGLSGAFPPGTYRVWIGSYDQLDSGRYDLTITDLAGGHALPEPVTWSFQGRFEQLDVAFSSDTVHGVFQDCRAFAATSDSLGWVDDIVVAGARYHNTSGYWDAQELCAIAALNAVSSLPTETTLRGSIEGAIPFALQCDGAEARQLLEVYVPHAVGSMSIDDIVVNGTPYHNGPSYWSGSQVVSIIASAIADPGATLFASGVIEGTPYSFAGTSPAGVQQQCLEFIAGAMAGEWIDDVSVNGAARHNSGGWWSPTDVCMIVSSLAAPR